MFGLDALELGRLQFAFTISFHIIFPAISIGLASYLAVLEGLWLKTKREVYYDLYRFWLQIFAVTFGMGVVSGVVMSYQFGTNWAGLSTAAGSIMGPLIFFLVFNAIRLATNWYGVMYGYEKGTELVDEMGGNKMRFLTEGSSVLGLLVMGALVAKWTTVNMPLVLSSYTNSAGEQVTTTVQTILDSLMPGIVPLLMTFACMWLLRKNVNPLIIILGLFALGIVGYAIGLFA